MITRCAECYRNRIRSMRGKDRVGMGEEAIAMRRDACGVGAYGCRGMRGRHPGLPRQVVPEAKQKDARRLGRQARLFALCK